jgi:hypothetical protein
MISSLTLRVMIVSKIFCETAAKSLTLDVKIEEEPSAFGRAFPKSFLLVI